MKPHKLFCNTYFFFTLIALAYFTGCVSVNIPVNNSKKSDKISYKEPSADFTKIKSAQADQAWLSNKTGNTISFISECENQNDPSLEQIESDSLAAISEANVLSRTSIQFNNREAHEVLAEGKVDGIKVKLKLIVFKKNNCNYTLSYGGVFKKFASEENIFNQFCESFKAP